MSAAAPVAGNTQRSALAPLVGYFLRLGAIGFGGPAALVGYMHRDLVERDRVVEEDTYKLALALAQIMPGPLAAQTAIAIGYFQAGVLGATLVGLAFVLPSFLMVLALSWLYVAYGGLWWMQAAFYGVGAVVIAIIAIQSYNLARRTNRSDVLSWAIFGVLAVVTAVAQTEIAAAFIVAGVVVLLARAWPGPGRAALLVVGAAAVSVGVFGLEAAMSGAGGGGTGNVLLALLAFFTKAGAFVFGSGLAIVPFLQQGVVRDFHWLTEAQFLDAVAVAMITPGPVVITVAFIGYLVAGVAGAVVAAISIFLPVYVLTIVPAPWFARHRDNPQLKAFVQGATAAATGAIAGAVVVLALRTLVDVPTVLIALVGLGVLWRWKVQEPLMVAAAAAAGLALWPLVHGSG